MIRYFPIDSLYNEQEKVVFRQGERPTFGFCRKAGDVISNFVADLIANSSFSLDHNYRA